METNTTQSYTVQFRNMSRVLTGHATLDAAISAGNAFAEFGAFDISVASGAIVWTWEQR